jgi:hypothetical protein
MKVVMLLAATLLLSGCKDRFRYYCQDPENWKAAECQKPGCVASGYCTEYLITTGENQNAAP